MSNLEKRLVAMLESVVPLLEGKHDGSAQYEDMRAYQVMQIQTLLSEAKRV